METRHEAHTADEIKELFGEKTFKVGNKVPAAWWITTDEAQLTGYDRWVSDYDAKRTQIAELAATVGLEIEDARTWGGFGRTSLRGFKPKMAWKRWSGDPGYEPVPPGWRVDVKKDLLVPSRKTKADRESAANADFTALAHIPDLDEYLTGMPAEIMLDDRDGGGTSYMVQYRRGEHAIAAFSGGDPDRQPDRRMNGEIDAAVWHRQKLSVLLEVVGK